MRRARCLAAFAAADPFDPAIGLHLAVQHARRSAERVSRGIAPAGNEPKVARVVSINVPIRSDPVARDGAAVAQPAGEISVRQEEARVRQSPEEAFCPGVKQFLREAGCP